VIRGAARRRLENVLHNKQKQIIIKKKDAISLVLFVAFLLGSIRKKFMM
jgi:hypothetical protein